MPDLSFIVPYLKELKAKHGYDVTIYFDDYNQNIEIRVDKGINHTRRAFSYSMCNFFAESFERFICEIIDNVVYDFKKHFEKEETAVEFYEKSTQEEKANA